MWSLLIAAYLAFPCACSARMAFTHSTGTFWHISDLHVDFYYTQQKGCPWSTGAPAVDPGPYGDYKCDCPWKLINSTLDEMKKVQHQPDFILFTGQNIYVYQTRTVKSAKMMFNKRKLKLLTRPVHRLRFPENEKLAFSVRDNILHTDEKKRYLSTELVLETEANLTKLIHNAFPNTKVFCVLGNHDYFPADNMPVEENHVRQQLGGIWKHWMDKDQIQSFEKAGYYGEVFKRFDGNLVLALLNTNLWDLWNPNVNSTGDPGGQFAWLESLLMLSQKHGQQVYIVGHIPPGKFELSDDEHWFYPEHNRRYVALVQRYADVIAGQFFAHNHRDSFRVFYNGQKKPISTLFITPSVTPHSRQIELANNPGIRLYEYDRRTSQLLDYVQYYFDLVEGNSKNDAAWQVEYRATSEFMTPDIGPASLHGYLRRLACADVNCDVTAPECEDSGALQRWSAINSVSYDFRHCDAACHRNHLCAMTELDYDLHRECVRLTVMCRPQ